MTPDFDAIERQLTELALLALDVGTQDAEYTLSECMRLAIRPLEERLSEPRESFRYASRRVGEAMIALVGFRALHETFDRLERHANERVANWVSRSWIGLQSSDGRSVWSD